jgi:hypothetical protein
VPTCSSSSLDGPPPPSAVPGALGGWTLRTVALIIKLAEATGAGGRTWGGVEGGCEGTVYCARDDAEGERDAPPPGRDAPPPVAPPGARGRIEAERMREEEAEEARDATPAAPSVDRRVANTSVAFWGEGLGTLHRERNLSQETLSKPPDHLIPTI